MHEASKPYMYVTFTMLGLAIYSSGDLVARYLRFVDTEVYVDFMGSSFWNIRTLPTLIAVGAMVSHMTWRAFVKGR